MFTSIWSFIFKEPVWRQRLLNTIFKKGNMLKEISSNQTIIVADVNQDTNRMSLYFVETETYKEVGYSSMVTSRECDYELLVDKIKEDEK